MCLYFLNSCTCLFHSKYSDLDGRKTQLGYTPKSKSNRIRKQLTEKEFENEAIVPG